MIIKYRYEKTYHLTQEQVEQIRRIAANIENYTVQGAAQQLVERAIQAEDGYQVTAKNPLEEVIIQAAIALTRAEEPGDEVELDTDAFTALAVRGLLRMLGIHARIRIRPEGGTRREDLERMRQVMSDYASLAYYD